MPELPEVETTRRGIEPHVLGCRISELRLREARLRWPVSDALAGEVRGQRVLAVERRGKYLLLRLPRGALMIHLGMSGSLRILPAALPAAPHEHADLVFEDGRLLRYTDPRRFGSLHWVPGPALGHPLLDHLGPEPLGNAFDGDYLFRRSRGRRACVKVFIMDARTVVGVGNIYASEALFRAGILPARAAGRISLRRYHALAVSIRAVLTEAIAAGGTTLRDFVGGSGQPGYFRHDLRVYAREGEPCRLCATPLRQRRLGQRATYFCPNCQR